MIKVVDMLANVDVKLFTRPCYEYDEKNDIESINVNCGDAKGNSRYFKVGDKVPWKTMWYNYSDYFLVVKAAAVKGENNYVCEIKDGMLVNVIPYFTEMPEMYIDFFGFDKGLKVFNDYGTPMNIHSDEDLYYYLLNSEECNEQLANLRSSFDIIQKPLLKLSRAMNADDIQLSGKLSEDINEALVKADDWFMDDMSEIFALTRPYIDEETSCYNSDYAMYGIYLNEIINLSIKSNKTFRQALLDIIPICRNAYNYIGRKGLTIEEFIKWNQPDGKEVVILIDRIIRGVADSVTL